MGGLPNLANKNIGHPVQSEFQIHNNVLVQIYLIYNTFIHTILGTSLYDKIVQCCLTHLTRCSVFYLECYPMRKI